MANQTANLGLTLPIGTEKVSRQVINTNMDTIDGAIGALPVGQTLQDEIDSANQAIANLAKTISSGSLHDIMSSGLYYLTNAVTDKPTSTGGYYAVSTNGSVVSGIYVQNSTGSAFSVTYNGTSWTYQQLATKSDLIKESTVNNATVNSAAAGLIALTPPTGATIPVCVSYINSTTYRMGGFMYFGAWYLCVFTNSDGKPVAASTNIGNIRVSWI